MNRFIKGIIGFMAILIYFSIAIVGFLIIMGFFIIPYLNNL